MLSSSVQAIIAIIIDEEFAGFYMHDLLGFALLVLNLQIIWPYENLTYRAESPVGGKDNNWRQAGLQGSVEECEAFNIQHVHFIYE